MIDSMQNWFLTNIEEDDGYTVMEFYRNITSCDNENDLNILVRTFSLFLSPLLSLYYNDRQSQ